VKSQNASFLARSNVDSAPWLSSTVGLPTNPRADIGDSLPYPTRTQPHVAILPTLSAAFRYAFKLSPHGGDALRLATSSAQAQGLLTPQIREASTDKAAGSGHGRLRTWSRWSAEGSAKIDCAWPSSWNNPMSVELGSG